MALGIGALMNAIGSPAVQSVTALLGGLGYRRSDRQAREANLQRYNQILSQYGNVNADAAIRQTVNSRREAGLLDKNQAAILAAQDKLVGAAQQRYDRFMPQFRADQAAQRAGYARADQGVMGTLDAAEKASMSGYSDLDRLYQDRLDRARGIVGGISDQDKQDAIQASQENLASQLASVRNRGYGGSTIQTATEGRNLRDRGAELRRVSDNKASRELGVESQFGGEALAAKERGVQAGSQFGLTKAEAQRMLSDRSLGADERMNAARYLYDTSLSGDVLAQKGQRVGYQGQGYADKYNQMAAANQNALNLYLTGENNRLGFMERRDDPYPQMDPNQYAQLGYNAGPLPQQPKWYENLLPSLFGGGAQVASAGLLANGMSGGGGYGGGGAVSPNGVTNNPMYWDMMANGG